jgi:hypothetical protein
VSRLDRLREALAGAGHLKRPAAPDAPAPAAETPLTAPETTAPRTEGPSSADLSPLVRVLGGEWIETARGPVFRKDVWFPAEHLHGDSPLGAVLQARPAELAILLGDRDGPDPSRLGFFDVETTGLSGGTGTYAFLACLGTFEGGRFRLRQYFLAGLDGEAALLEDLASDMARLDGLVTYNGRSFDVPLIETRWTLARIPRPPGWGARPHFDLIHPIRRLHGRRLPTCRLSEVERALIGFRRKDDVPSQLVPTIYFDYLRAGRIAPLRGVLRHNAWDVLSMVGILSSVLRLLNSPSPTGTEAASVGRWWELERRPERAEELYRTAISTLEPVGDDAGAWTHAARRYAILRKRAGARREVVALWERLWAAGDPEAGVEIAKYLEHEARDLSAAESVARALLERARPGERAALEHRLRRIRRKLAEIVSDAPAP